MKETLEEAALRLYPKIITDPYNPSEDLLEEERNIFIKGGKWQDERMNSKEQIESAYREGYNDCSLGRFADAEKYYNETFL